MPAFELVLNGFDGSSDQTDHLILWVWATDEHEVRSFIEVSGLASKIQLLSALPPDIDEGAKDFSLPSEAAALKARIESLVKHVTVDCEATANDVLAWTSDPVNCPFCGDPEVALREITEWTAQSIDDPGNVAELTEYQCHGSCQGRSFWI